MYIGELKATLKETVGKWAKVRPLALIGWIASIVIYVLLSKDVGFIGLVGTSIMLATLTGREYVIANLYRIRTITTLRERLLVYGDGEFVLRDIQNDRLWRGDPPDPEISKRLDQIAKSKNEMADQIMKMATELFSDKPVEDKTPN